MKTGIEHSFFVGSPNIEFSNHLWEFDVPTRLFTKNSIFLDTASYSPLNVSRRFGEAYRLLQIDYWNPEITDERFSREGGWL
jgi:hypothetical protein